MRTNNKITMHTHDEIKDSVWVHLTVCVLILEFSFVFRWVLLLQCFIQRVGCPEISHLWLRFLPSNFWLYRILCISFPPGPMASGPPSTYHKISDSVWNAVLCMLWVHMCMWVRVCVECVFCLWNSDCLCVSLWCLSQLLWGPGGGHQVWHVLHLHLCRHVYYNACVIVLLICLCTLVDITLCSCKCENSHKS